MTMRQTIVEAKRFYDTVSYLKAGQIISRVMNKAKAKTISVNNLPAIRPVQFNEWIIPHSDRKSRLGATKFSFLNETHDIEVVGWDNERIAKLWRYNLHYFDWLNEAPPFEGETSNEQTIEKWIAENQPFVGTAWEPYPTSLRIVNWIKWHLAGKQLDANARRSLALQARWLHTRYETHLLGNHLLANAKAMLSAGFVFGGSEAEKWVSKAIKVLLLEHFEQVLQDGGHFELSPMYHAIILEDCLDILNLLNCVPEYQSDDLNRLKNAYAKSIPSMLNWMKFMTHSDGEIAFFNDAAMDIAKTPLIISNYAKRLGFAPSNLPKNRVRHLNESGYVRIEQEGLTLIADVGPVGPDYLAGHAHADTLSFELSVGDERFIVNSGVSEYGVGNERQRQRGTAAHNTVCLGERNSSDVWHGFRTGKRAKPLNVNIKNDINITICASHDGYAPHIHKREWHVDGNCLTIHDSGFPSYEEAIGRLHFHPDIDVMQRGNGFQCISPQGRVLEIEIVRGYSTIVSTTWHPGFGRSISNSCIETKLKGGSSELKLAWKV